MANSRGDCLVVDGCLTGVMMSPFRKGVNECGLMFILVHTLAEGVG